MDVEAWIIEFRPATLDRVPESLRQCLNKYLKLTRPKSTPRGVAAASASWRTTGAKPYESPWKRLTDEKIYVAMVAYFNKLSAKSVAYMDGKIDPKCSYSRIMTEFKGMFAPYSGDVALYKRLSEQITNVACATPIQSDVLSLFIYELNESSLNLILSDVISDRLKQLRTALPIITDTLSDEFKKTNQQRLARMGLMLWITSLNQKAIITDDYVANAVAGILAGLRVDLQSAAVQDQCAGMIDCLKNIMPVLSKRSLAPTQRIVREFAKEMIAAPPPGLNSKARFALMDVRG